MQKFILLAASAGSVALSSCIPPEPAPRYPRNTYGSGPEAPYDERRDISPPPGPTTPPPAPTPTPPVGGGYPVAQRTANPDQVLSPYEPYNVIDVAGFKSGQLARDPSNQKIFRIP